jgi:hypothetical protein
MLEFLRHSTGHAEMDAILRDALARWRSLAETNRQLSPGELEALYPLVSPDVDIPQTWASSFYLLSYADQQSTDVEPGFAGWLQKGPGFALNHVSLLRVLTQGRGGVLGILHRFLETILEQAGDWDGDRITGQRIVKLLEELDIEYHYNIHDRELWPAVLQLLRSER